MLSHLASLGKSMKVARPNTANSKIQHPTSNIQRSSKISNSKTQELITSFGSGIRSFSGSWSLVLGASKGGQPFLDCLQDLVDGHSPQTLHRSRISASRA